MSIISVRQRRLLKAIIQLGHIRFLAQIVTTPQLDRGEGKAKEHSSQLRDPGADDSPETKTSSGLRDTISIVPNVRPLRSHELPIKLPYLAR
eukprot:SAG31_NODE_1944_length_6856_cov_3.850969_7_plen_92_part_00